MKKVVIKRTARIKDRRKVGLDTGVLVTLIEHPEEFGQQAYTDIFSLSGLFFTHRRCIIETIKKLREHKQKNVENKVYNFIKKNKIKIIEADYSNNELANKICSECGLHKPDRFILADFIKAGINTVRSTDGEFIEAAKKYGIDATRFHHIEEKDVNKKLKDLFKGHYKRS